MASPATHILNREAIPEQRGALIIPNRFSFHDLLLLEKILGNRSLVYLVEENAATDPHLAAHLEREDVTALVFTRSAESAKALQGALESHLDTEDLVVYVPGLSLTRQGSLTSVPAETLEFILSAGVPTVPLFIDYLRETRLSIERLADTDLIWFSFGALLEGAAVSLDNYRENLLLAGEAAFNQRPVLEMHLSRALLEGLKHNALSSRVIDGLDEGQMRFDKLLAVAIAVSKVIRQATRKDRVGIILPPGRAGIVANLAVLFAGKIPVNLNFTGAKEAVESCIRQADLDHFISVDAFARKVQRFPWPPNKQITFLERLIPRMKLRILYWFALSKILSSGALASLLGIPARGGDKEAVLLFTSGSSGEPKGVPLSHRNLLANVNQFGARLNLGVEDRLLACLPLFHSFGSTVTLWYPIIEGVTMITYPSPLEAGKLAQLVKHYKVSLLLATPTFLRGYLRKAEPKQLASAKLVVTGAEKLPRKVAEEFEKKFGKPVLEGYGLTETSPVTNVNLPDPDPDPADPGLPILPNARPGSVGQMLPGVTVRISDPDSGEHLPLRKSGMIWLRGANIFKGYLDKPELTREVIAEDGWFKTGDIGRMDADGFLYIEGRLSRFSKIAGEMVPHETIEAAISKELGLDTEQERKIAVVGIPDESKGETLVLLSATDDLDVTQLRYKLLESGMTNLWIPKKIVKIDPIPVLASGKLDIKACETAARRG